MKVIEPGHWYLLDQLDQDKVDKPWSSVELRFVSRVGDGYPGNEYAHPGTNLQEVWRVCADRLDYLNRQIPCWQTRLAIRCMLLAIWLLEHRAAKRHKRKFPLSMMLCLNRIDTLTTCKECGHVHGREQIHARS